MLMSLQYFEEKSRIGDMIADLIEWIGSYQMEPESRCMYSPRMLMRTYVVQLQGKSMIPVEIMNALQNFRYKRYILGESYVPKVHINHNIYHITPYCRVIFVRTGFYIEPPLMEEGVRSPSARDKILRKSYNALTDGEECVIFRVDQDFGSYFASDGETTKVDYRSSFTIEDLIPCVLGGILVRHTSSPSLVQADYYNPSDAAIGKYSMYKRLRIFNNEDGRQFRKLEIFWTNTFQIMQHFLMVYAVPLIGGAGKHDSEAIYSFLRAIMEGRPLNHTYVEVLSRGNEFMQTKKINTLIRDALMFGSDAVERHKTCFEKNVLSKVRHLYV